MRTQRRRTTAKDAVQGYPVLAIDELSVTYTRANRTLLAVDRFTLNVEDGEFVCIVGASGCGKTTLLKAVDGLIPPAAGSILIRGHKTSPTTGDMAMVFQSDSLFPWRTVFENVRFGLDIRGVSHKQSASRAQECIDLVKLTGFEASYPHELSGGMRQRVNLARALAVDPVVLLMDEPFAALDAQTREIMQDELLDLWGTTGKTVLFITHQLDEAVLLGDRVIVMSSHPGRVREEIKIDIPRPRDLHSKRSAQFSGYVDHIWDLIEDEVRRSVIMKLPIKGDTQVEAEPASA